MTYITQFDYEAPAGANLALALGDIRDIGTARVRLNGHDLGVTWTPPFRLEIGDALKPRGNVLEVEVTNSWRNRLVGNWSIPKSRRFTRTYIKIRKDWELLDEGLLGPVQIYTVKD